MMLYSSPQADDRNLFLSACDNFLSRSLVYGILGVWQNSVFLPYTRAGGAKQKFLLRRFSVPEIVFTPEHLVVVVNSSSGRRSSTGGVPL